MCMIATASAIAAAGTVMLGADGDEARLPDLDSSRRACVRLSRCRPAPTDRPGSDPRRRFRPHFLAVTLTCST
jgi:hypothetical protein